MASFHIPLTCEGRRWLIPVASTAFEEVDHHVVAHVGGEVLNAAESYDQIAKSLAAPTVQDLCGRLISASTEAINTLQFALDHRRMPARDVTTMLASVIGTLSTAVQQTEGR